jgi:Lar family restriction alleviation protein
MGLTLGEAKKLGACPFCGSYGLDLELDPTKGYYVYCSHCRTCGPIHSLRLKAIDLWNQRYIEK